LRHELAAGDLAQQFAQPGGALAAGAGIVKLRLTTLNQDGEPVQIFTPTLFVDRRPDQR